MMRVMKFIVPMLMLMWITYSGYQLTITTNTYDSGGGGGGGGGGGYVALLFGVVTAIFGLIYFVIGLTMVADLALDLLAWFRHNTRTSRSEEKEQTANCQIFVHSLAIMVSALMLTWTLYYGYKLVTEAQDVAIHNRLAFLIGVISMAFGFIYLIIGLGIIAQYVLDLPARLHTKDDVLLDGSGTSTDV